MALWTAGILNLGTPHPFLFFLHSLPFLPTWLSMGSYQRQLDVKHPIGGDDWSRSLDVLLPLELSSHIHPLWVYLSIPSPLTMQQASKARLSCNARLVHWVLSPPTTTWWDLQEFKPEGRRNIGWPQTWREDDFRDKGTGQWANAL